MPIYDARRPRPDEKFNPCLFWQGLFDARLGSVSFPPWPSGSGKRVVVDAAGNEYEFVLWCDTDTGELEYYIRRDDQFVLDDRTKRAATVKVKAQPPLELLPYAEEF